MNSTTLLLLTSFVATTAASKPEDQLERDLRAAAASKGSIVTVVCGAEIVGFASASVDSIVNHSVFLKKKSQTARLGSDAVHDSIARWNALELIEIALSNGSDGTVKIGAVTVTVATLPEKQTCEVERLLSDLPTTEFEKPILVRQAGVAGQLVGWSIWEYTKPKPKGKPVACRVHVVLPAAMKNPSTQLDSLLLTSVQAAAAKATTGDGSTGNDVYVLVQGVVQQPVGTFAGFGFISNNAVQMAYRIVDSTGRLVLNARRWQSLGRKAEKDLQEVASRIPCN
ncbi:MAG TPA: hypothetical protein VM100_03560 [Longimicrobiales bacterium]|nr:hypothetical protein [Longimicrobiales bacterium]